MSKIGKKPIAIPKDVTVTVSGSHVVAKGPKGELIKDLPAGLTITIVDGVAKVVPTEGAGTESVNWGLGRSLLSNMITGVSEGFKTVMEFSGVGYKAQAKGPDLEMNLGFTNPVMIKALPGVTFQIEKSVVTVMGMDKESVGHVAAQMRAARLPEPYKGSGVKYQDEIIRKKAGKKAAGATGAA